MRTPLLLVASLVALLSFASTAPAAAAPPLVPGTHLILAAPPAVITAPLVVAVSVRQATDTTTPPASTPPATAPINGYQMLAVTLLGSLFTWLLSHYWTGFSGLGDVGKWGVVLLASLLVSGVVHLIHGDLSPDVASALKTALDGVLAAITSGTVFKFGTTKPA